MAVAWVLELVAVTVGVYVPSGIGEYPSFTFHIFFIRDKSRDARNLPAVGRRDLFRGDTRFV